MLFRSAEYIMRNAGLDEAQVGIKIAGRNINNFRYADDTIPGCMVHKVNDIAVGLSSHWNSIHIDELISWV